MVDLFDAVKNHRSTLYDLLDCDELSTKEQINAEFKQRIRKLHPDKRPEDKEAAKQFERLCQARDTLCDDQKRKEYDHWLRSGVTIPFEMWSEFKSNLHSSVHWAPRPPKKPMLECTSDRKRMSEKREKLKVSCYADKNTQPLTRSGWRSKTSSHISKFRKYEI